MNKLLSQKIILSVVSGLIFGVVFGAQEHILDVCIHVDKSKVWRRNDVDTKDLKNYERFGMNEPLPFDQYFHVESALYTDRFDNVGCVEVKKDLTKEVPSKICIASMRKAELCFPKHASESFVEAVKRSQDAKEPLIQIIYQHKKTVLKVRYTIQEQPRIVPVPVQNITTNHSVYSSSSSFFESFIWMIDALSLLATTNR